MRGGLAAIRTVCRSFARVSPVNLVVAASLAGLLGQRPPGAEPTVPLEPAELPAPLPAMPGIVPEAAMAPAARAALAAFETDLAGEVFVPGLYRILARWPGFLAHLAATLGPLLRDPAALEACEGIAGRITALAPSRAGGDRTATGARAAHARRDPDGALGDPDLPRHQPANGRLRRAHPPVAAGGLSAQTPGRDARAHRLS